MTDITSEQEQLRAIRAEIDALPTEQRALVLIWASNIRQSIREQPLLAVSLALVGAEIAAEDELP